MPPVAYFGAAGVILVVAVVAVAAVIVFGRSGGASKTSSAPVVRGVPDTGPVPSAYSQAASTPAFGAIAAQAKDRRPLTAAEVFATKRIDVTDAKASLKRATSRLDARCTATVWGSRLAGTLQQAGCTQAAREVYTDKHFAALVTIFNLADSHGADQAVAAAEPGAGNGFPLAPSGSVSFGQAFSIARGVAMGHYAVITWVERADGTGNESDPALLSLLVSTGRPNAVLVRAAGSGQTR